MVTIVDICRTIPIALALLAVACEGPEPGVERVHRVDGDQRIIGALKHGLKHGPWVTTERGRVIDITHWRDGVRHGPFLNYFDDDRLMLNDGMRKHDKLHGRYRIFFPSGQIAILAWFSRGYQERTWCAWELDGSLEYIAIYQQDQLVRREDHPPGQCPVVFGDGRRHLDPDDRNYD